MGRKFTTTFNKNVFPKPEPEEDNSERIQIRLSKENYDFLKAEAKRTCNTLSGLASLAVADWITERKIKSNKTDIEEFMKDPEFKKQLKAYLNSEK
jgi:DNA-binding transcriptional regulator PaaX